MRDNQAGVSGQMGVRQAGAAGRPCKDCADDERRGKRPRPAPYPGPRCATHHRAFRARQKAAGRERSITRRYGVPPGSYAALLAVQGGFCAGCGPRTKRRGLTKALAVDHDHRKGCGHPGDVGCPQCVRGLLCSTCNQLIGWAADDPLTLLRLVLYLINPPADGLRDLLGGAAGGTVADVSVNDVS